MSNPGFTFGFVPTAAQWNSYFDNKADAALLTEEILRAKTAESNLQGNTTTAFNASVVSWWSGLPTTLPSSSGMPWNNGGFLSWS